MSKSQSSATNSVAKTVIGLAAIFALAAGVWFGIQQSSTQSSFEQRSSQQQESEGLAAAKAASGNSHIPVPADITDVAFLLELELQNTQSKTFKISEKLSNITLVNFWATWCAPCREEMPVFNAVYQKHKSKGFGVLGLTVDNPQSTEAFIKQLGIAYPILMAEHQGWDLLSKTGNPKNLMPYSFLIDQQGVILEKKLGPLHEEELEAWVDKYL